MATEHALTPSSYIAHHLAFNTKSVGGGFWVLHVDTLIVSLLLGVVAFGFTSQTAKAIPNVWLVPVGGCCRSTVYLR